MKQILILSGKGGTGKTTISSAFIKLANALVYADCDVDAPNLHLVMGNLLSAINNSYYGNDKAFIDEEKCEKCGQCIEKCRFNAIKQRGNEYVIDYYNCEGCGVCEIICSADAISLKPDVAGKLILDLNERVFSTAQLKMGSGTSGKLVSKVKKQMIENAVQTNIAIIDGSPGIGCPVIASISGVNLVLIVSEPSISGISDLERIIETSRKMKTNICVCINKYDINLEQTNSIINICRNFNIPIVGKIPYDSKVMEALNMGKTIIDIDCNAGNAVKDVFNNTINILLNL